LWLATGVAESDAVHFGVRIVIDPDGYRPNVGIVLMHPDGRVFWARRVHRDGWQFPQGGMNTDETPLEAMYRELREETGLLPEHVEVLGATPGWLRYRLPQRAIRRHDRLVCIGQKQVWFLLRLTGQESDLCLDLTDKPEFDHWRWVDFWYPVEHVVVFKRGVYASALRHLAPAARQVGWLSGCACPGAAARPGRNRQRRRLRPPGTAARGGTDPLLIDNHSHSWRNHPAANPAACPVRPPCTSAFAMGLPITTSATRPKPAAGA
jgi:putative (di)nucleoside polyphosphate hydrolase